MRPLTERRLRRIRTVLLDEVRAFAPDWTDQNDSDPGVTLLQLFAFLTESLLLRQKAMPPRGAAEAKRLAEAALSLTGPATSPADCEVRRVNYFSGQLLGEADFRDEQSYFRNRLRRLNRFLQGSGVVSGLGVSIAPDGSGQGQVAVVEPGFAFDPRGEEIEVCAQTCVNLPPPSGVLLVQLIFSESLAVPVAAVPPESEQQFSRVEETFAVVLAQAVRPDAVPLARLTAARGRWQLDRGFKRPRARR
ncbi:MAG TPA: hypothetical protein VGK70_13835 [Thermoanaerobaculia bacterium]|jgi:hypothetical protein